jgi:hypothetical protein
VRHSTICWPATTTWRSPRPAQRRYGHDRTAHRHRRRRRRHLRGHHGQARGPRSEGVALHRVRGHRLLAVRHPVRVRRRDPALRGPLPLDGRPLRLRRPGHAHGDGRHRRSTSTAARSRRATSTRASTS